MSGLFVNVGSLQRYAGRIGSLSRAIVSQQLGPLVLDLDFLAMGTTLDSRVTYTRAGNASRINSAGAIEIVGSNVPRFDFDPVTLAPVGLIVEGVGTNLISNSANPATQSVSVGATTYTLSFYGSGTVVLSGTASATVVGTGAYPTRTTFTFTPTAGTLTLTITGTVQWANLETGTRATSWIPGTGGGGNQRNADFAVVSGTNFSSIYNTAEGTLVVDIVPINPSATGAAGRAGSISTAGGGANRVVDMFYSPAQWTNFNGIANMAIIGAPSAVAINRVAGTYKSGAYNFAANGTLATPRTDATVNIPSVFGIGNLGGLNHAVGHIRRYRYYNIALTGAEIQALTAP